MNFDLLKRNRTASHEGLPGLYLKRMKDIFKNFCLQKKLPIKCFLYTCMQITHENFVVNAVISRHSKIMSNFL